MKDTEMLAFEMDHCHVLGIAKFLNSSTSLRALSTSRRPQPQWPSQCSADS